MKLLHDYLYRFALRVIISTALLICLYNHEQNVAYGYSFFNEKVVTSRFQYSYIFGSAANKFFPNFSELTLTNKRVNLQK